MKVILGKKRKKERESWKKNEKMNKKKGKILWITVVIYNDLGVGEQ
jgi:hypothetical protein